MSSSDPFDLPPDPSRSYTRLIRPWNTLYTRELSVRHLVKRPGEYYSARELRAMKRGPRTGGSMPGGVTALLRKALRFLFGK